MARNVVVQCLLKFHIEIPRIQSLTRFIITISYIPCQRKRFNMCDYVTHDLSIGSKSQVFNTPFLPRFEPVLEIAELTQQKVVLRFSEPFLVTKNAEISRRSSPVFVDVARKLREGNTDSDANSQSIK
eukprot:scaffold286_cov169-Amphora_coffeaeformis.AAC.7